MCLNWRRKTVILKIGLAVTISVFTIGLAACQDKKPHVARVYPAADSAGARLLLKECSSCHNAPLPQSRNAQQWPYIVKRMQQHRLKAGLPPLKTEELTILIQYLSRYAGV